MLYENFKVGDWFSTKIIFRSIVLFKEEEEEEKKMVKKYATYRSQRKIQTKIIIIITKTIHALQIKFLTTADLT